MASQSKATDADYVANFASIVTTPRTYRDNAPIYTAGTLGEGGTPSYYMFQEPTSMELYYAAHYTAYGNRLTYGYSKDLWNNEFSILFTGTTLKNEEKKEKNRLLRDHLRKIHFFENARNATAFDYEQGESLLIIYREGDLILPKIENDKVTGVYANFNQPAKFNKKIIRVEAINKIDYNILSIGSFGIAEEYKVNFYSERNMRFYYTMHTSHAIRWKAENTEYDQYKSNGKLKPCFPALKIIDNIDNSISHAVMRWGGGLPVIMTKGLGKDKMAWVKELLGDPTFKTWLLLPKEHIDSIEMKGYGGNSLDLSGLEDLMIDQLAAVSGIPKGVLKQTNLSMHGPEVYQREYFAVLDRDHTQLNRLIREFAAIDPEWQEIVGDEPWEIDWGLRQVMTEQEKADLMMRKVNNARQAATFLTLDECRAELGYGPISKVLKREVALKYYMVTPEDLGQFPPDLGTWKQRTMQSILTTPEEAELDQEEEQRYKASMELQGNKTEQAVNANTKSNSFAGVSPKKSGNYEKENARVQGKNERKTEDSMREEILFASDEAIISLQDQIDFFRREASMDTIAKKLNIGTDTLYKVISGAKAYREELLRNKKEKKP